MTQLIEYSREVMPMVRKLADMKEELKSLKEDNQEVQVLLSNVKQAQEALAKYLETNDDVKQMLSDIKDVSKDIQQAVKRASKGSGYKPKELKDYFFARAKEDAVVKTVQKGKLFDALNEEIDS